MAISQLAAIVESSEDAIISKDLNGVVQTWNRAAETIYGYPAAEMIGKPMATLLPPDRLDEEPTILAKLRSGDRVEHFETVRVRRDGRHIHVSLTLSPICSNDGQITGISHIARDITRAKHLDEKLQLSQRMEAVGRLAGGIAHDFNNLLSVISGYAVLLQERVTFDEPTGRMLQHVLDASGKAAELTKQLLAFSRRKAIQCCPVDLNQIISETELMLRRVIGEDVVIRTRLAPDLWKAYGDPGQLGQVIMNLALNARDAMPDGGTMLIETENWRLEETEEGALPQIGFVPGDYVRMLFSDTGHGMDAVTASRIFEPFFTTKDVGKGTGLGLSTVYGIIQQSGGHISVYSEPGHGTTFTVYLRRAGDTEQRTRTLDTRSVSGTETILLVEDDPGLRALANTVLSSKGYTILDAATAEDALALAHAHAGQLKLMLTDIVMPGTSGHKLAALMSERRSDMKIVFMSGYSEHTIVDRLLAEPGTAFLQKPFTPTQLLRKVRDVLDENSPNES